MDKPRLLVLSGPTGIGKTKLSLSLAKKLQGEIISADSMQVYRGMDIGTAKIKPEEMEGIPHHLIDILDPDQEFDVTLFQKYVKEALKGIYERGHLPILTGGTGFYIQAILKDVDFNEEARDEAYRRELTDLVGLDSDFEVSLSHKYSRENILKLHSLLKETDPESAEAIPPENVKRVIRALEYVHATGGKISEHKKREQNHPSPYDYGYYCLTDLRYVVYTNIEHRVDKMMEEGLVQEVEDLLFKWGDSWSRTARKALGYREILSYLAGEVPLREAVNLIKRNTRHFAKRQVTWMKRESDVIYVEKGAKNIEELAEDIISSFNRI